MFGFGEINTLFDSAVMNGIGEIVGFLFLCAKIYGVFWVVKTIFSLAAKKGK